nr:MAG TPA: hypothetical protein [Caudoviricetes sp.]
MVCPNFCTPIPLYKYSLLCINIQYMHNKKSSSRLARTIYIFYFIFHFNFEIIKVLTLHHKQDTSTSIVIPCTYINIIP